MPEITQRQKYTRRFKALKDEATEYRTYWKEIVEYLTPRKGKYLTNEQDDIQSRGQKKDQKVINGSARDALRIVAAGMQSGITSPSRPWFILGLADRELMDFAPVKQWLYAVRDLMLTVFAKSNFYSSVHGIYSEMAAYGTSVLLEEEDFKTVVRFRPFTIGEYYLALDSQYRPSALYRQYADSARQIVDKFGEDNVSDIVKSAIKNSRVDTKFEILHCIQPNTDFQSNKKDFRGKTYESVYLELNGNNDKFLRRSGYNSIPFVAPRWEVAGVNTYGDSPGMDALGDIKQLQKMEEKKLKALDKLVDPPMNAPTAMKGEALSIIAGGVNFIDTTQGAQSFTPTYQVNPDIQNIAFEIDRVEYRIRRFFFNDLFLAILNVDKRMTATEVAQRHEEKLLMMGPVLERLQSEFLDQIIDRTYNIMLDLNLIPPAPEELEGREIKVDYIGLLAQAQKIVGISAIERTAGFVGNLATMKPEALDKFDVDQAIDLYSDMISVPPEIIVSDDVVANIRAQRAQAQQLAAMQAQMAGAVQGAKTMSETNTTGDNLLTVVGEALR